MPVGKGVFDRFDLSISILYSAGQLGVEFVITLVWYTVKKSHQSQAAHRPMYFERVAKASRASESLAKAQRKARPRLSRITTSLATKNTGKVQLWCFLPSFGCLRRFSPPPLLHASLRRERRKHLLRLRSRILPKVRVRQTFRSRRPRGRVQSE